MSTEETDGVNVTVSKLVKEVFVNGCGPVPCGALSNAGFLELLKVNCNDYVVRPHPPVVITAFEQYIKSTECEEFVGEWNYWTVLLQCNSIIL